MPVFSHLHRDWFSEPLVALMNLGSGGNAITLSDRLIRKGVRSGAALGEFIRNDPRREALVLAHVFGCSMHHYLLRDWLAASGIDPDKDVRLRVFPPNQLSKHMANGNVDGFCVGEPWNTLATQQGIGSMVAVTADIVPNHPEKILAVSRKWMKSHNDVLPKLIRAVLRACAFCDDEANWPRVAELLAAPQYIDVSAEVIAASLKLEATFVAGNRSTGEMGQRVGRSDDWRPRSFAPETTFPSRTHMAWLVEQMVRWSHVHDDIDVRKIADLCTDSTAYRAAAESLGIVCPSEDYPPMPLRNGRLYEAHPLVVETGAA
jgi:ABC-type nitrate/sulfonate/bicarbonate transport system substrate-binding protein